MMCGLDARDMEFLAATEWSDAMLDAVDRGWKPPCTEADLDQVWTKSFHDAVRDLGLLDPVRRT